MNNCCINSKAVCQKIPSYVSIFSHVLFILILQQQQVQTLFKNSKRIIINTVQYPKIYYYAMLCTVDCGSYDFFDSKFSCIDSKK